MSEDQQRALFARNWTLTLEWLALGILDLGRRSGLAYRHWARGAERKEGPGNRGAWLSIRISHSAWVIISSLVKYLRFFMNVVTKGKYIHYNLMSNPAM